MNYLAILMSIKSSITEVEPPVSKRVQNIASVSDFCHKGNNGSLSSAQHSFETNKLTMLAAFFYCNWSIKMARVIWFGSRSVDIGPAYVNNW